MSKINLTEEIKRITNEIAANAAAKALEVSNAAVSKAAEVSTAATAEAARVSTLAIAKALDAATLAAVKAADAASAAAAIASSTSGDLQRIKEDIIKINLTFDKINEKLDNKYVTKDEFKIVKNVVEKIDDKFITKEQFKEQFSGVKNFVYGVVGLILTAFFLSLIYLVIKK